MKTLILSAAVLGAIALGCYLTPTATAEDPVPAETKENGGVFKRGIGPLAQGHGHGHGQGHNSGWGHGGNNGWGWNNYVSDYGFKIGPQKSGDGWGWGWGGQSFANFNPGWSSYGHGHGHGHHGHKYNH